MHARAGGFWTNVICIQPPLTIREERVEKAVEAFERAVKEVNAYLHSQVPLPLIHSFMRMELEISRAMIVKLGKAI